MQVDMHYYGTYAMARAAGLKREVAEVIAYAAQYVDDNAYDWDPLFALDAGHLHITETAHHSIDKENLSEVDQRLVWVPFHFLPGNEGDSYEERLICRKDSDIARQMLDHHLNQLDKPYGIHLIGLAAHVYADTFSHYGFSGISSDLNKIDPEHIQLDQQLPGDILGYIQRKFRRFMERIERDAARIIGKGLGHGAVHTYPDRPYLRWRITNYRGEEINRDNPATFLEGCEKLHGVFSQIASNAQFSDHPGRPFGEIRDRVAAVLAVKGDCETRIEAWQNAAQSGDLFGYQESIRDYDAKLWSAELENFQYRTNSADALETDSFRFLQAAAVHRTYVLRDLLPEHGLVVR